MWPTLILVLSGWFIEVFEIIESYESKFSDLEDDRDRKIESIEQGDSIDQGAIKNVRVFVAKKQKRKFLWKAMWFLGSSTKNYVESLEITWKRNF